MQLGKTILSVTAGATFAVAAQVVILCVQALTVRGLGKDAPAFLLLSHLIPLAVGFALGAFCCLLSGLSTPWILASLILFDGVVKALIVTALASGDGHIAPVTYVILMIDDILLLSASVVLGSALMRWLRRSHPTEREVLEEMRKL